MSRIFTNCRNKLLDARCDARVKKKNRKTTFRKKAALANGREDRCEYFLNGEGHQIFKQVPISTNRQWLHAYGADSWPF